MDVHRVGVDVAQSDGLDSYLPQAEELRLPGTTVPVDVRPQPKRVEDGVPSIDDAIAIVVVLGQRQKAVWGSFPIRPDDSIAEELRAAVDRAVTAAVENEQHVALRL